MESATFTKSFLMVPIRLIRNLIIGILILGMMGKGGVEFIPFMFVVLGVLFLYDSLVTMTSQLTIEGDTATYNSLFKSSKETEVTAIDCTSMPIFSFFNKVIIKGKGASVLTIYCISNVKLLEQFISQFKSSNNTKYKNHDHENVRYKETSRKENDKILIETAKHLLKLEKEDEVISFILEHENRFNQNLIIAVKEVRKMFDSGKRSSGKELLQNVLQI